MMYIQATHDVVDARYPCSEQDSITLAALQVRLSSTAVAVVFAAAVAANMCVPCQVQEEYGDHPGGECSYLSGKLSQYLAEKYLEGNSEIQLEDQVVPRGATARGLAPQRRVLRNQIMTLYGKLNGYSQQEARLSYLDYVKSWKIYGSSYYFAEPQNNRDFPPGTPTIARAWCGIRADDRSAEVVLAINAKGILVVDPESKEFLKEYPYSQVTTTFALPASGSLSPIGV
jgi:hypothetical protein